jgi:hypothetical protein
LRIEAVNRFSVKGLAPAAPVSRIGGGSLRFGIAREVLVGLEIFPTRTLARRGAASTIIVGESAVRLTGAGGGTVSGGTLLRETSGVLPRESALAVFGVSLAALGVKLAIGSAAAGTATVAADVSTGCGVAGAAGRRCQKNQVPPTPESTTAADTISRTLFDLEVVPTTA